MAIAEIQLPDGRVVEMEVPSGASHDDIMSFAQSQFQPKVPTDSGMAINTVNKTIASIPDQLINAPGRIANAGIVGYGELSGNPVSSMNDPRLIKDFDPFQKLFNKTEMTRPELEPQTKGQKLASALISGATGALMMSPAASISGNIGNAFLGGMSNLAAEKTKQETDSDALALAAGLASAGGMIGAGAGIKNAANSVANKASQLKNVIKNIPSQVDDFALNKINPAIDEIAPVLSSGIKKVADVAERPFTAEGQNSAIGDHLYDMMGSDKQKIQALVDKLKNTPERIPGLSQTAGEITHDPIISGIQRNLEKGNSGLDEMRRSQIATRLKTLDDMILPQEEYVAAKSARSNAATPLYEDLQNRMFQSDQDLEQLLSRIPNEIKRDALKEVKAYGNVFQEGKYVPEQATTTGLLDNSGQPILKETPAQYPVYSGHALKAIQKALSDFSSANYLKKNLVKSVSGIKPALNDWVNSRTDNLLSDADSIYQQMSMPLNKSDVVSALRDKISPAISDLGGTYNEAPSAYARALRDVDKVVNKATGQRIPISDLLSEKEMQNVHGIGQSLADYQNYKNAGTGVGGSPTFPLFDMDKKLSDIGVPKQISKLLMAGGEVKPVTRMAKKIANALYGDVDAEIKNRMAEAFMKPGDELVPILEETLKKRNK